jgi:hypothetical protein
LSIQRSFLWGGGLEGNKMCWVSWDRICQPKEKGGLGRWKWRCLKDRTTPSYELLGFRYGFLIANFLYNEGKEGP